MPTLEIAFKNLAHRKLGVALLAIQIALASAIFSNLEFISNRLETFCAQSTGIHEEQLLSLSMRLVDYKISMTDIQEDIQLLEQLPQIMSVAYMRWIPLWRRTNESALSLNPDGALAQTISESDVSPFAIATLDLQILTGRDLNATDFVFANADKNISANNVLITQSLAEHLFGKSVDAINKMIYINGQSHTIVGVCSNWPGFKPSLQQPKEFTVFIPQILDGSNEIRYLIRASNGLSTDAVAQSAVKIFNNKYLVARADKISAVKADTLNSDIMTSRLLKIMNLVLGMVVAIAIGGQTFFWVGQRTKQIGIRRALGASKQDIMVMLLQESTLIACLGLVLGIYPSLAASQYFIGLGYPHLPVSYLLVTNIILLVLCLASTAIPIFKASKLSPSLATRTT